MRINKNIAKILTITLLLNNLSILSNATTFINDVPNRYQTLEGEYITIDDSTKGELYEIEVFGNTVQDESNLEDIQSVGDLYVDENGNPILDSQGREQYKINIVSTFGLNLTNKINPQYQSSYDGNMQSFLNGYSFNNIADKAGTNIKFYMDCDISKEYTVQVDVTNNTSSSLCRFLKHTAYHSIVEVEPGQKKRVKFKLNPYANDILFYLNMQPIKANESVIFENFIVLEGDYESVNFNIDDLSINKTAILLPTQLQKVGNIADRLYWDNKKGKYIIEKNIQTLFLNGSENWNGGYMEDINISRFSWRKNDATIHNLISDKFRVNHWEEGICIHPQGIIYITVPGVSLNTNSLKNYLYQAPIKILYQIENPLLIETNIISKIKVPTYENKTHIYAETENGINPTLKVKIDRINKISQEAVDEAENESTIHSLNTARNLVNHMDEGELKEELQQRLNNISSLNDLQLERKTSTSNVDIYIKSENMLSMTLSTNSITFEDYSGVDELEQSNAIKIDINSSLPYQLNAYLIDEMYNNDKSKKIDIDRLNIRDNSESDYKEFTSINNKLILKDNCNAGNDIPHNIDLKLLGSNAYPADIYKTVIKFEAEQK